MASASPWTLRATGAPGGMVADEGELRRGLSLLADPDGWCQVVGLPGAKAVTLAGGDLDGLCAAVEGMPSGFGVYLEVNPVREGLTSKAKAADVVKRRWLFIDVDPLKAGGFEKHPATEEEKNGALEAAQEVFDHLTLSGWPAPAVMDSGNGWYLLYRIDLPNDEASRALIKAVLYRLAELVADRPCSFDKSVHNADRLAKVPGTWARKGAESEGRPYRPCKILSQPAVMGVVTAEQMTAAAGEVERTTEHAPEAPRRSPWQRRTTRAGEGERAYALAALDGETAELALTAPGDRNNQLYRSGAALGEFVGAGHLSEAEVMGALTDAARRCGLLADEGAAKVMDCLKRSIEKGKVNPRKVPERNGKHEDKAPASSAPAGNSRWRISTTGKSADPYDLIYTLPELLTLELPSARWAVPGLLSEGLTILAGKPKLGKSWMALNLAMTIAAGGKALGSIQVQSGDVLYLALEDRLRRIRDRAAKVLGGMRMPPPGRLSFAVTWPRQDRGGVDKLAEWLETASDPRLVVIDVWAKFRSPAKTRGSAYEQDYDQLTEVKSCADHYGASALAVHHTRKSAADDVFDEISGTLGIAGAADGSLVLSRSRGQNEGTLAMTGRDIEEQTLAVEFDPSTFTWKSHGSAEQRFTGELQKKIVAYLQREGEARFVKDIAAHLGKKEPAEVESVRTVIRRLCDDKVIRRVGNAYAYPGDDGPDGAGEHWTG